MRRVSVAPAYELVSRDAAPRARTRPRQARCYAAGPARAPAHRWQPRGAAVAGRACGTDAGAIQRPARARTRVSGQGLGRGEDPGARARDLHRDRAHRSRRTTTRRSSRSRRRGSTSPRSRRAALTSGQWEVMKLGLSSDEYSRALALQGTAMTQAELLELTVGDFDKHRKRAQMDWANAGFDDPTRKTVWEIVDWGLDGLAAIKLADVVDEARWRTRTSRELHEALLRGDQRQARRRPDRRAGTAARVTSGRAAPR